jgi:hypothetical protein
MAHLDRDGDAQLDLIVQLAGADVKRTHCLAGIP